MADLIYMIVNPVSGRGQGQRLVRTLRERIVAERDWPIEWRETRASGDALAFSREAGEAGARAIVVCGGDGTINEVVRGLDGREIPILVAPGGTENILAKVLGVRPCVDWLWRALSGGRTAQFDVLEMNGRRFLLIAGMGFDAEVVRLLTLQRRGHISYWSYVGPILKTLWSYRHPTLRVEVDGELLYHGPGMAFVGNVARYALGLQIVHRASPDNGRLDVCVFPCRSILGVFVHAARVVCRGLIGRGGARYGQGTEARIVSEEPTGIELDGDYAGNLPATFRVCPDRATFLVSPDPPAR